MAAPGTFQHLLLTSHRGQLVRLVALMMASALTEGFGIVLLVPMLAALGGIDAGSGIGTRLANMGVPLTLGPLLAVFVALVFARAAINYARGLTGQKFEMAIVDSLRARAWSGLLHCDWRTLSAMRQSDSASLLITNVDRVGFGVNQALGALTAMVTLGGIGLAALAISPLIALAAAIGGALVLLAYRGMRRRAAGLGEQLSAAYEDVYGQFQEGLGALRVIKSFGREDEAARRGTAAISGMRRAQLAYVRDVGLAQVALQGGGAAVLAVLVWFAFTRWDAGAAQILPLVALSVRALPLLGALQQAWQNWAHSRPALAATMALIGEVEAAQEPSGTAHVNVPVFTETITFDNVCVRYSRRETVALDAIGLTIRAREVTALTGPSGAGKSTLADLLGGLIAPDEGGMAIDGQVLDAATRRAWRSRVAYVQQAPVLFTGTVRDNLLWADPDANDAQLFAALESASATFVAGLPDGLDTRVGDGGRDLSGGERQRLVLARALLREPALLILDEATSALDAENEAAIAAAIERLRARIAIVIIGHRGALSDLADTVVRLEHGRIVNHMDGRGT